MKQLQNNFTTPEQSKRLLELGLPANSADMYYQKTKQEDDYELFVGESIAIKENLFSYRYGYSIPCWSVGRLMEIYEIVGENAGQCLSTDKNKSRVERLVQLYEENVTMLNFSKMEE